MILTARNPERLEHAAHELGALRTAAFDATDPDGLDRFFAGLPKPIDHLLLSGGGPYYAPLAEADFAEVREDIDRHLLLPARIALHALVENLALEIAPIRVNVVAPGFVDTPLSASLLGDRLDARRQELRATLPIGRVVGPGDVAALAVHLMANTAVTGATYDVDGGQKLV